MTAAVGRTSRSAPLASPAPDAAGPSPASPADRAKAARSRDLETASREFEAIFVRSMMKNCSMGGKGEAAYGDMAVDAVAKSVTAGRGLGLGELIRHAIEKSERPLKVGG
jgi:Rod binding domain-containing protein